MKIMTYHYTLIGMVKYKNMTKSITGKDEEQQELSFVVSGNSKWYSHFGSNFLHSSTFSYHMI